VTSYVVAAAPANGAPATVLELGPHQFAATMAGLTNGTEYSVTVTANTTAGAGSPSTAQSLTPSGPAATATTLSAGPNPATTGTPVTYTAQISPAPDGGTVAFFDNGAPIASCATQALSSGTATCTQTYANPGAHSVSAAYNGDAAFAASGSPALTETINAPAPT
jgi:hypothetical protein